MKEKVCLSVISVGQCFGEIEILKNTARISNATCISTKVSLWVLPVNVKKLFLIVLMLLQCYFNIDILKVNIRE